MSDPYDSVWMIDERDFPQDADAEQALRFALRYAILAPSGHNGQPWCFHIDRGVLQVRADRTRALPTIDPHDRELLISCAATAHITQLVLERFGYRPAVRLRPDASDADLLATIEPGPPGPQPARHHLFDAIVNRHSNRHPYQTRPVPADVLARLFTAAVSHDVWLHPVTDRAAIAATADLIAQGDRIKWSEAVFRHELAERIIPNRGPRRDGMPGYAFGIPGPLAYLAPTVVRHVDLGRTRAAADRKLALATPMLAIIGVDRDEPDAWMTVGQAMSHILLQATADGLATSFLSQAIEVPELRSRLAALLHLDGHPQLLLRLGYPRRPARPAPRRPLADVLTTSATGQPAGADRAPSIPGTP
jgi:nitroreductase